MAKFRVGSKINASRRLSVSASGAATRRMVEDITGERYRRPGVTFDGNPDPPPEPEPAPEIETQQNVAQRLAAETKRPIQAEPLSELPILDQCADLIRDFIQFDIGAIIVWKHGYLTQRQGGAFWTLTAVREDGSEYTEQFWAETFRTDNTAIPWLRNFCLAGRIPFEDRGRTLTRPKLFFNRKTGLWQDRPVAVRPPIADRREHYSREVHHLPPKGKVVIKPAWKLDPDILAHVVVDYCREVRQRTLEAQRRAAQWGMSLAEDRSQSFPGYERIELPGQVNAEEQSSQVIDFEAAVAELTRLKENPASLEQVAHLTANQRAKLRAEAWWIVARDGRAVELVAEPTIRGHRTIYTYRIDERPRRRGIAILTVSPESLDLKLAAAEQFLREEIARLRAGQFGKGEQEAAHLVRPWDVKALG